MPDLTSEELQFEPHRIDKFVALPTNTRLVWKSLFVSNTVAYLLKVKRSNKLDNIWSGRGLAFGLQILLYNWIKKIILLLPTLSKKGLVQQNLLRT